jgi:hypothetical protein
MAKERKKANETRNLALGSYFERDVIADGIRAGARSKPG